MVQNIVAVRLCLYPVKIRPNNALHQTAFSLRSKASGELVSSLVEMAIEKDEKTALAWLKKQAKKINNKLKI